MIFFGDYNSDLTYYIHYNTFKLTTNYNIVDIKITIIFIFNQYIYKPTYWMKSDYNLPFLFILVSYVNNVSLNMKISRRYNNKIYCDERLIFSQ